MIKPRCCSLPIIYNVDEARINADEELKEGLIRYVWRADQKCV